MHDSSKSHSCVPVPVFAVGLGGQEWAGQCANVWESQISACNAHRDFWFYDALLCSLVCLDPGGGVYLYLLSRDLFMTTLAASSVLWAVTLIYGDYNRRTQKVYQDVLAASNSVSGNRGSLMDVLSLSLWSPQHHESS